MLILLTGFILLIISNLQHEVTCKSFILEEVTNFCKNNGHKYVALWGDQSSYKLKKEFFKISSLKNLTSQLIFNENLHQTITNMDTLIMEDNTGDLQYIFEVIHQHKIQKSILILNQNSIQSFRQQAEKFAKNSYFYLLEKHKSYFSWYIVMTFNGLFKIVMNKIEFNTNGHIIESYNLNGLEILPTTLSWSPYTMHENCNKDGRQCKNSGLLVDMLEVWARNFNFTWDIHVPPDNDWGLYPVSGRLQYTAKNSHALHEILPNKNLHYTQGLYNIYVLSITRILWQFSHLIFKVM